MMRRDPESPGSRKLWRTGDSNLAIAQVWAQLEQSLTGAALRMTKEWEEQEDLLQEALVELWMIDPTRFDLRDRADMAYLRRLLINRMWDVWRKERRALHGSWVRGGVV
jgi:DNA-directed RNA polymerase specialized sigma24 family protein